MATKKKSSAASKAGKGDERQKVLDASLSIIEKYFGKGAVMRL